MGTVGNVEGLRRREDEIMHLTLLADVEALVFPGVSLDELKALTVLDTIHVVPNVLNKSTNRISNLRGAIVFNRRESVPARPVFHTIFDDIESFVNFAPILRRFPAEQEIRAGQTNARSTYMDLVSCCEIKQLGWIEQVGSCF